MCKFKVFYHGAGRSTGGGCSLTIDPFFYMLKETASKLSKIETLSFVSGFHRFQRFLKYLPNRLYRPLFLVTTFPLCTDKIYARRSCCILMPPFRCTPKALYIFSIPRMNVLLIVYIILFIFILVFQDYYGGYRKVVIAMMWVYRHIMKGRGTMSFKSNCAFY